jgi:predicted membrane protein
LLRLKRRASVVASAAVFAAVYAVLGTIPVSRLVLGAGNFLTASNFITPLAGMMFGPYVGGFAAIVGDLLDVYAGVIAFNGTGLSIMAADLATVVVAGLAFGGRRKAALAVPLAVIVLYWADPISVLFVGPVPFTWLHMVSVVPLAVALALEGSGRMSKLNPAFVVSVTFAALLCGQLTGTLVGQELAVRVFGTLSLAAWQGTVKLFFPLYPVERTFFTAVGSAVSLPVLRALKRRQVAQRPQ